MYFKMCYQKQAEAAITFVLNQIKSETKLICPESDAIHIYDCKALTSVTFGWIR